MLCSVSSEIISKLRVDTLEATDVDGAESTLFGIHAMLNDEYWYIATELLRLDEVRACVCLRRFTNAIVLLVASSYAKEYAVFPSDCGTWVSEMTS